MRANRLAEEALRSGLVRLPGLARGWSLRREATSPGGSRIDFLLTDAQGDYWVEVKNVTWVEDGVALFPDAVTSRGARHVGELTARLAAGDRAALVYVVQRCDARGVRPAHEVDAVYAEAVASARQAGLEQVAVEVAVTAEALSPHRALPVGA
jgi:sugar fermentation stimulation protein A